MIKPRKLSESTIVQDLAESVCERVKNEVIRTLKGMEGGLSGEDSGLSSVWEEICVQLQYEESVCWDTYDMTVRETVQFLVEELPTFEREALWLLTGEGSEWEWEDVEDRDSYPIRISDIVRHVVESAVYEEGRFSTAPNVLRYLRHCFGYADEAETPNDKANEDECDEDEEDEEAIEGASEEDATAKPCG
jgi:hypothetical protein